MQLVQGWDLSHFNFRRRHSRQLVIIRLRLLIFGAGEDDEAGTDGGGPERPLSASPPEWAALGSWEDTSADENVESRAGFSGDWP